nr:hypothetical protein [Nocardia sp. CS682]
MEQLQLIQSDHVLFSKGPPGHGLDGTGSDASTAGVGCGPIPDLGYPGRGHFHHYMADGRVIVVGAHHSETEPCAVNPAVNLSVHPVPGIGFVDQVAGKPATQTRITMCGNQSWQVVQPPWA